MAGPSQSPSPDVRIVGFVEGVRPKEYLPDGGRSTKPEVIDLCSDDKSSFGGDYSADEVIFCVSSDEDDSRSSINDVFLLTKTLPPPPPAAGYLGLTPSWPSRWVPEVPEIAYDAIGQVVPDLLSYPWAAIVSGSESEYTNYEDPVFWMCRLGGARWTGPLIYVVSYIYIF